jgi:transcriptional regulator with XRE-family HTH domain
MALKGTARKMDFPAGVSLGRAIRAMRIEKDMSLSQLALAASLDKGYLSRVERGLKVPSVAIILRISTVLEVSAAQLFGAAENHDLLFVTRAEDANELTADDGNYVMRLLTQSDTSSGLEVFLMYPPVELADEPDAEHRGEELLFVVSGKVEIRFPDQNLVLGKGDSVQFPGPLRHQVRRLEENSCVLIAVSGS